MTAGRGLAGSVVVVGGTFDDGAGAVRDVTGSAAWLGGRGFAQG